MKSNLAKHRSEVMNNLPAFDSVNSEGEVEDNTSVGEELKLDENNELSGLNHEMSPTQIVEA